MAKLHLPAPIPPMPLTREDWRLFNAHIQGRLIYDRAPDGRLILREITPPT